MRVFAAGAAWWPLQMARELDDAILTLRTNHLEIGTWLLRTQGDVACVLAADATLAQYRGHWFVREVVGMVSGSGFAAVIKPDAYGATKVADKHSK